MVSKSTRMQGPIAITGVAALFPGSTESTGFWKDILRGSDLLTDVPPTHWRIEDYWDSDPSAQDKTHCRRGAFLPSVEFDSLAFGIPPTNMAATDTAQLLALIVARKVLEDASRGQFHKVNRDRISVILGVAAATELVADMSSRLQRPVWLRALRESGIPEAKANEICEHIAASYVPWQENTFPGLLGNVVAGRIANRLDLHGTNCVVDAACASSLSAISAGINELHLGSSDLALVGGVDALNTIFMYMCFSKTHALSPTGDCRPFSDQADGTMLGEGIGMFALRRLEDAESDGDPIYAVIRGVGSSSDGAAKSIYAPEPAGQAVAVQRAYDAAAFGPETIELVEAHGTGTKAGDAAELGGLCKVYEASGRNDRQWCAIGSVKSQIGHTKGAAGAAGLFKAVMALQHKVLPPTIKVERPNPELGFERSPFYINTRVRPWIRDSKHPRRAAISAFGFGGSNYHLAVEEYTGPGVHAPKLRTFEYELVVLGESSLEELVETCRTMMNESAVEGSLAYLVWRAQISFDPGKPYRLAIVASDESDLKNKLERAVGLLLQHRGSAFTDPSGVYGSSGALRGPVAFLFPGQGSQYVEMGASLAMSFDEARAPWDLSANNIAGLHQVVFPRPGFTDDERVAQQRSLIATEWAQPAIGTMSMSCLGLLRQLGVTPSCVAGHSFGELSALYAAGVMKDTDFLRAARRRGELMASTGANGPAGAMTAAEIPADLVESISVWGGGATVANMNSPRQTVLTGTSVAIDEAEKQLMQRGINCFRLPVATAFHSSMVASACGPFESFLQDIPFKAPIVPVYANTTADVYPSSEAAMRNLLAQQIAHPVLFSHQIEQMYLAGARIFIEVGPSDVLTRLVNECLGSRDYLAVPLDRRSMSGLASFWHALAQLAVAGVPMRLKALWTSFAQPENPSSVKKPALSVWINGSNAGKPASDKVIGQPCPAPIHHKEDTNMLGSSVTVDDHSQAATAPRHADVSAPDVAPTMVSPEWHVTLQQIHKQTTEAHSAFQKAITDGHLSYLKTVETFLNGASNTRQPAELGLQDTRLHWGLPQQTPISIPIQGALDARPDQPAGNELETMQRSTMASAAVLTKVHPAEPDPSRKPTPMPRAPAASTLSTADAGLVPSVTQEPTVAASEAQSVSTSPHGHMEYGHLKSILLEVVSEKTGYPVDMIDPSMELEGTLGIDSIKRVEIFSAMQERVPGLPEIKMARMAALRNLDAIVHSIIDTQGAMTISAAQPVPPLPNMATQDLDPASQATSMTMSQSSGALQKLLFDIVSEKTGYPVEVLSLPMEMESDLGIDSIKRVEIISAIQSCLPELPEIKSREIAALKTLKEVVGYVEAQTQKKDSRPIAASAT